ncbi:MAG: aryl-sulfate sulfotransferase [Spirochaetaceae bacterium]
MRKRFVLFFSVLVFVAAVAVTGVAVGLVALLWEPAVQVRVERADAAPLSALLTVEARRPVRVELHMSSPQRGSLELRADFDEYRRRHELPVLGLHPDAENRLRIVTVEEDGRTKTHERTVQTPPLPDRYPEVEVARARPDRESEGLFLLQLAAYDEEGDYHPLASAVDSHGNVRWLYTEDFGHLLSPLRNGKLMVQKDDDIVEIDWLGRRTGKRWTVPEGLHHDAVELADGNFLALSAAPGSFDDGMVEIDRDSGRVARSFDFREILDPRRPRQPINLEDADWLHLNGIDYDAAADAAVVSGRDQSAVVKVDLDSGEPVWILSSHTHWSEEFAPYLLEPTGEPFEWSWGQHAPELYRSATDAVGPAAGPAAGESEQMNGEDTAASGLPSHVRRVLVYDNGNHRSYDDPLPPDENYSRAVEYEIDEAAGTVEQLWQYGKERGSELFTPFIGDADYLPNGNRLVVFGGISRDLDGRPQALFDLDAMEVNDMKISARVVEVTDGTPARRVVELGFEDPDPDTYAGYRIYQAEKIRFYDEGSP